MIMRKISGFTLIELMVLVAILGLLMAIAGPSLNYLTEPEKITSAARELHSGLHVARSEAIRWNAVVCVCPSSNASTAAPSCSGNDQWENGWIAFRESTQVCVPGGADDVLVKAWDGKVAGQGMTIRNDDASINSDNMIRFTPRGQVSRVGGGSQKGTFTLCDNHKLQANANGDAMYARGVNLHMTGRARITKHIPSLTATNCP